MIHTSGAIRLKLKFGLWGLLLPLALLVLSACSSGATEAPTLAPNPTQPPAATAPTSTDLPIPDDALAVLPTPAPGAPSLEAAQNVNLRSGPGQNYPILAIMSGGMMASLVGVSPDTSYYVVSVPVAASGQGWVDAKFALVTNAGNLPVIQPPPLPPTAEFVGPQPGEPQGTAVDTVYVRSGPGNQYPAYGIAAAGSSGLIFGHSEDGQWWTVRLNPNNVGTGFGWVAAVFVTTQNTDGLPVIQAPPVPTPVAVPSPEPGSATATAADYVNVRTGPGLNYPVLGVGAPGASAEISGKSADGLWWQVVISSGLGWVSSSYVTADNADNVPVIEAPPPPPVSPTQAPGVFGCVLVSQSPADGTVFSAGESFDMVWQIQNTSSTTWSASDATLQFLAASDDVRLSTDNEVPLTADVPYGGSYQASVSMTAPAGAGQYSETWGIVQGGNTLCQFYNIIEVK
jgi:uncharacterized protein YraI